MGWPSEAVVPEPEPIADGDEQLRAVRTLVTICINEETLWQTDSKEAIRMKFKRRLLLFVAFLLFLGVPAFAQMTGVMTGTITSAGAPLPGATITISSPSLQGSRSAVSDVNGNYNVPGLPPGDYSVSIELGGLKTVNKTGRVSLDGTTRVDGEMKPSSVTEAITVTASAPTVTETTEVLSNLSAKLVATLPTTRTLLATVGLMPGVSNNGVGGATAISGSFSYDSSYYVDGAVVNEVLRGQPDNLFIEDALQETTVHTGAISAEYGRFTGGVVTAISKSGGNEYSGTFRDSVTNPAWTSRGDLDTASRPTSKIQPTYEGTLGGRIVRDRVWFFTAGRFRDQKLQNTFGTLAADPSFPGNGNAQSLTYPFGDKERRLEGKLTVQLSPKHTFVGSYFDIKQDQTNDPFGTPLEPSALDASRSLPNTFYTLNYNGVVTNNFFIEATYAKKVFKFVNSGADGPAPPEVGSVIRFPQIGGFAGGTIFCGGCTGGTESRNNYNGKLKGTYFASTKGWGTHTVTAGFEDYQDMLKSNNYQSASDFTVFGYDQQDRAANGQFLMTLTRDNGFIVWFPILAPSQGNAFNTKSGFVNDKWDYNSHLSFNLGTRYDHNQGENEAHAKVASDSRVSPRLGATYDVWGDGRVRLNASYSQYASKIANGNVGDATSGAGQPSYLYWIYDGPDIIRQPTPVALKQIFTWFNSVGGIKNTDLKLGGGAAGVVTQIQGQLKSPGLDEYTLGASSQIGQKGFIRADYQYRKWNNFYTSFANTTTGKVFDPLAEANVDLTFITNSNDFTRLYRAVLLQGAYRFTKQLNLGANYTYSTLKGNIVGESAGGGPNPANSSANFPEFNSYANRNPIGYLPQDARHKVRGWLTYDVPIRFGNLTASALERFDSGTAYSEIGSIFVSNGSGSRCTAAALAGTGFNPCASNATTKYSNISGFTTGNYYFSKRGTFRTANDLATDLSLNYSMPVSKVQLYVEGQVLNAFNAQNALNVDTTILTATSSKCVQTTGPGIGKRCYAFNPFTDTPVEGVNWIKGPSFGKPVNPTSAATGGDFQLPLTYRFSFGARF